MALTVDSEDNCQMGQPDPERSRGPTARQRLGELLRLMPYQTNPDDLACDERIAELEETVMKEEEEEAARQRNIAQNMTTQNISSDEENVRSGISIRTEDIPPNYNPPLSERRSNPIPADGTEWDKWIYDGIPNPLTCMELFRSVLIGDFPLMNRGVPRWLLFILNCEIFSPYESSIRGPSDSRNLTTFGELNAILWRDHRIGLCQWRELIIRGLRSRVLGG